MADQPPTAQAVGIAVSADEVTLVVIDCDDLLPVIEPCVITPVSDSLLQLDIPKFLDAADAHDDPLGIGLIGETTVAVDALNVLTGALNLLAIEAASIEPAEACTERYADETTATLADQTSGAGHFMAAIQAEAWEVAPRTATQQIAIGAALFAAAASTNLTVASNNVEQEAAAVGPAEPAVVVRTASLDVPIVVADRQAEVEPPELVAEPEPPAEPELLAEPEPAVEPEPERAPEPEHEVEPEVLVDRRAELAELSQELDRQRQLTIDAQSANQDLQTLNDTLAAAAVAYAAETTELRRLADVAATAQTDAEEIARTERRRVARLRSELAATDERIEAERRERRLAEDHASELGARNASLEASVDMTLDIQMQLFQLKAKVTHLTEHLDRERRKTKEAKAKSERLRRELNSLKASPRRGPNARATQEVMTPRSSEQRVFFDETEFYRSEIAERDLAISELTDKIVALRRREQGRAERAS